MIRLKWRNFKGDLIATFSGYGFTLNRTTRKFEIVRITSMQVIAKDLEYKELAGFIHILENKK